jgi:hypothetical protein
VACCILLAGFTISQLVSSDPCLIVYPGGPCLYWYDPSEYYTVAPGHPFYDPAYDRGGTVLLEIGTNQVDVSIYQAPGLLGFVVSTNGQDGYHFTGSDFQLIVDGFSNVPTTYSNILIVFDKVVPAGCAPTIRVGGAPLSGGVYHAGDLLVQTPTPNGNNYSDTITLPVSSTGCTFIHVWAFSDADHDNAKDGGECFTAFSHDIVVPVENSSWGRIKVMYR